MSRKIAIILTLFLLLVSPVLAREMITIPADSYERLLERLERLEKRVSELEQKQEKTRQETKEEINDIYDTLDTVETKILKDKLDIGAELRTRVDFYALHDTLYPDGLRKKDLHNDNFWSNRFRLNLEAKISKNLLFHGRLAVYKNWADSDRVTMYADPNRVHVPDDTTLKLDRAYVDWIIPDFPLPLAITFGRQPSTEGPPFEFKENRPRQSTYPALLFDGEADGIVATFGLERILHIRNCGLRIAYGKGYQSDDDDRIYLDDRMGLDDLDVLGLFFEGEIPHFPGSLFVISYVNGWNFVDNPLGARENLGDMQLFGVHLQVPNLFTGFDAFFSYGVNWSDPNGQTVMMPFGPAGLLSDDGKDDHTGWAIYTGFRYRLPFSYLKGARVGFEYNHGSKYWFSFTQGSTEIYNKLATRGDVFDWYYLQPFNRYFFFRTGFTYIDYDYTLSGWHLGQPHKTSEELTNFYMLLDIRF